MRRYWPAAAAVATLVALAVVFYRKLVIDGLILGDYDAFVYFYPLRQYAADALKAGRFPLWNPDHFMGAPFFANVQTAVLYPANLVFLWLSTPYAYSATVVGHVILAGVGMYFFAKRSLEVTDLPALIAAIAFMFCGFLTGQVGHVNQLTVAAWLPWLLLVFDEAVRRRSISLAIGAGLVGSLQLFAGHTQEWYFCHVTLGLFCVWRMLLPRRSVSFAGKEGFLLARILPLIFLMIAGTVEVGLTAVQVLPSLELSAESIRGGGMTFGEAASFSLPPSTALYTLLPRYPAELFSEYVGYIGLIPLILGAIAIAGWTARPIALFMAGLAALGLFLAFGGYNPVFPFLYHHVPGFALFRVPARWIFVYTFGVAALAGLGAQVVFDLGEGRPWPFKRGKKLFVAHEMLRVAIASIVLGAAGVILIFLFVMAKPRPTHDELLLWAQIGAVAIALSGMAWFGKGIRWIVVGLLLVAVSVELWTAGGKAVFRNPIPAEAYRPERASTSYLLKDAGRWDTPGRMLSFATDHYEVKETPDYKKEYSWLSAEQLNQFMVGIKLSETLAANLPIEYGIETVDGYDGGILPLKRYGEFKSIMMPMPGIPADNQLRTNLIYAPPERLLDLMNVRYVLGTKLQDTKIDNVYYDRGLSVVLDAKQSAGVQRLPQDFTTTAIGVISSTEGAREMKEGVQAGSILVTTDIGVTFDLPLRMGVETGETPEQDAEFKPAAHPKPLAVPAWDPGEKDADYFYKIKLPMPLKIKQVQLKNVLPDGKVRFRALTLIDDQSAVSYPLVMWDRFDRQLFFDMKLYTNRDLLPRAFMVHSSAIRDDGPALEAVKYPEFPIDQAVVLAPSSTARTVYRSVPVEASRGEATLASYEPEQISVDVSAVEDGYLVLSDPYYPGWIAEVDGNQVPIERANYLFRSVFVGSGQHHVVFRYAPASFQLGLRITLISSTVIVSALLLLGWTRWRRGRATVV